MRISILLPYKENFSPEYPGAVSLFVYETTKISKIIVQIIPTVVGSSYPIPKIPDGCPLSNLLNIN